MEKQKAGGLAETIRTVLYAVVIALAVRTFAYEPFNIPSGSMKPTLLVGDFLFVSKFSYGYSRYSLPWSLPLIDDRIFGSEPERGDVVVFKLPSDTKTDYIKRLIGLPGDRIMVRGGILHINGTPVQREELGEREVPGAFGPQSVMEYSETLPNGRQHLIREISDDEVHDDTREFVVPPDHYFFMGDNRDRSQDSRTAQVGFVPAVNLIGRAEFLFFSHNSSSKWWEVWRWPAVIRFSRIGRGID
ncbi:MAG: signal peptidase I [Kiloniellales bacterium]|jgi:signal peptidase I